MVVDIHDAHLETFGETPGARQVACPDGCAQPVTCTVDQPDGVGGPVDTHDGEDRPECLVAHDGHALVTTIEDRRRITQTLATRAAAHDASALGPCVFHVRDDDIE